MSVYKNQLDLVKSYGLISGESVRVDCPFCGSQNTFTITKKVGTLLWYCFSASCQTKGRASDEYSKDDFLRKMESSVGVTFQIPDHWVGVQGHTLCMKYLEDNHCLEAVLDNRAEVMYDPRQNRCVFLIRKEGVVCDAVGRVLDSFGYPKWLRYGSTSSGYCAKHTRQAFRGSSISSIVVEDCASACAVSCIADGYGLLGTNLTPDHILDLRLYDHVYIALDPDAISKAIQMQKTLSSFVRCSVWFIEDDLKYYNKEQLEEMAAKWIL